ncbi:MAG TPA: hypothetical protein VLE74_03955 [Candidatus Saccharimonadales bacterium]|nr:hypothetical protein [Candidatus Saccharimonadales bacterium]
MAEGTPYFEGPDFSSLAEKPAPTPEKLDDDDDDVVAEKPKPSIIEVLKGEPEKPKDDKLEKKEPEPEPPLEKLSEDEEQEAALQIAKERAEELENQPEPTEEDLAAAAFVENLEEAIDTGAPVNEAMDSAQQKALEVAGIETPPEDIQEEEPEPPAEDVPPPVEMEEPVEEEEPPAPVPPTAAGGGTGIPPVPPVPPAAAAAANMPPSPPVPPGAGPPFAPGGGGPGGKLPPNTPNTPNIAANTAPNQPPEAVYDRHSHAPYVLAGGLVGYLLGRRRGRIKTEKKLLPIQHKLEKEVNDLRDKIRWREEKVRTIVREKVVKEPEAAETIKERYARREEEKERIRTKAAERRAGSEKSPDEKTAEVLEHPEKIGKFAVLAERPEESSGAASPHRYERLREERVEQGGRRPVEIMTLPELLLIAERIHIEQSSLRRLYETHRLDDEGLRRVVEAYLRGERYDRILNDNLLTPEQLKNPTAGSDLDMAIKGAGSETPYGSALPPALGGYMSSPESRPDPLMASEDRPGVQKRLVTPAAVTITVVVLGIIFAIFLLR